MCTCYGNMLRPGDAQTAVQGLAALLPNTRFEAYHGLVNLYLNPPRIALGPKLLWDPVHGAVISDLAPGPWEPVYP
jgi:hypothetical protein